MQIQRLTTILIILFIGFGCANNPIEMRSFIEVRQPLAEQLEADRRYADALQQWQILAIVYPENEQIEDNIARLNHTIAIQVKKLRSASNEYLKAKDNHNYQHTNLKILALQPNDAEAKKALQEIEWENAHDAASEKTAAINEYIQQSQKKAKKSIRKSQYQTSATALLKNKKYAELLSLSEKYLVEQPTNELARVNLFESLRGLGDIKLAAGQKEQSVPLFEKALLVNTSANKKKVANQVKKIKQQLSDEYYRAGLVQFKTNIDDAIQSFERAQFYNPENYKAVQQYSRAKTIRENLMKIRAN